MRRAGVRVASAKTSKEERNPNDRKTASVVLFLSARDSPLHFETLSFCRRDCFTRELWSTFQRLIKYRNAKCEVLSSLHVVVAFPECDDDDDAREEAGDRASRRDEPRRLETKTKKQLALLEGVRVKSGGILEERRTRGRGVDFHRMRARVYVSLKNGARDRALGVDDGGKDDVGGSFRGERGR